VPGHLKGDGKYIMEREPRYVLFIAIMATRRPPTDAEVGVRLAAPSEVDLWADPEFHRLYRLQSWPIYGGMVANWFERRNPQ
jgi:hypothetical protein